VRCNTYFSSSANTKWLRIIVLDQDLQRYLDEAPDGVIYFSIGSNLRSTSVLEQPSNAKLGKWLPQSDILCKNCYTGKTVGI